MRAEGPGAVVFEFKAMPGSLAASLAGSLAQTLAKTLALQADAA